MTDDNLTGMEIAVIGMAGRFPAAKDLDEFWHNLKNGKEAITFFSQEELIEAGEDPALVKDPGYVKTCGSVLEEREYFDAAFFGYKPLEAEIMDPQTRLFLETSWHAVEDAGYDPEGYPGLIGLYGGSAWNFPWEAAVQLSGRSNAIGGFTSWLYTNRDNLCTLVSYNLGLKGPSVFVKSTCSTSLTAVHMAGQAILNGECEMALAGGAAVGTGKKTGYRYQEGMIHSPDGHCRAFDAEAKGTVGGEGVGIVVLKRLSEAMTENDHIYAVIKGTAVNNDGTRKIGYTAPSIPGQVDVIREALQVADVAPESITYVETHGTGTPVGDPIEIEALQTALRPRESTPSSKAQTCFIGSIKTNIGHLDAAAGIAAFIKTVLALKHKLIPPGIHFQNPNPKIDFAKGHLRVNTGLTPWKNDENPLRAGVSSFGIGGTNVHVILEEAPVREVSPGGQSSKPNHLLLLSAKTRTALEKMTENLAEFLKNNPGITLADVAYTLQCGRQAFAHRRMLVCTAPDEASAALTADQPDTRKVRTAEVTGSNPRIVFMFPGLGGQYANMGRELYETEPFFRETIDTCFEILTPLLNTDLKEVLYPSNSSNRSYMSHSSYTTKISYMPHIPNNQSSIDQIDIAQPVLFVFEYALAQLLMKWGIKPAAMTGYSFGEYTAACIAGVYTLEEALKLIVTRGELLRQTPEGAMLSVPLPKEEIQPFLEGTSLSLAVDNGPSCIVSGTPEEIRAFTNRMKENRYICMPLANANRALHSHMMKPVLPAFAAALGRCSLKEPQIPYISNVTGRWVGVGEVTRPAYWTTHLSETVQFAEGIKELLKTPGTLFLEVGPGYDLSVLVRHHLDKSSEPKTFHFIDRARGAISEYRYFSTKIGELWQAGVTIDWAGYYNGEQRQRVSLPLYPFEKQRYWLDSTSVRQEIKPAAGEFEVGKKPDMADWFYVPTWKRSVWSGTGQKKPGKKESWLVFIDETGLGEHFIRHLEQEGEEAVKIKIGTGFKKISLREYIVDPNQPQDYHTLFEEIRRGGAVPARIAHFWMVSNSEKSIDELQILGFYSLIYLAQAAGKQSFKEHLQILVISDHMQRVTSEETLSPGKAAVLGAVKVIPREYFNISCRSIDIVQPEGAHQVNRLLEQIFTEFTRTDDNAETHETVVAYRGDYRWEQIFEPLRLQGAKDESQEKILLLKPGGVYLITGGLGGIGMVLAGYLARRVQARLVLTGRTSFPPREQWDQWQAAHPPEERITRKIKQLLALEKSGAELLVCTADVSDLRQMQTVVTQAVQRFGQIDGVIHAAGIPDGGMIPLRSRETIEPVLAPKVKGTMVLDRVLKENPVKLDFFFLCSSISAVIGMFGQVAYCAANAFLDAYAYYNTHEKGVYTVSVDWDFWQEVGMGVETVKRLQEKDNITDAHLLLRNGLLSTEGIGVFDRVLGIHYPQVIVTPQALAPRLEQHRDYQGAAGESIPGDMPGDRAATRKLYPRPVLTTEYVAPGAGFEQTFAGILQEYFGFEQVGIDDNLFEYGITSLDMIHINNTLRDKIHLDIPIVVMFEYPTIRSLGHFLENREKQPDGQLEDLDEVEDLLHGSIDIFEKM